MNLRDFRKSQHDLEWELPAWGHPISQGVMPLLIGVRGRLFPVGTIFATGKKVQFLITATHNIDQIVKEDPRFANVIGQGRLEGSHDLSDGYALYALHHRVDGEKVYLTLWPLEKIDGASPTDVVFAHPQFSTGIQTLVTPISFDIPAVREVVLSIGYSEFNYPDQGIDLETVKSGGFDWLGAYSHKLFVTEGTVERIFTQKFASGYVAGPCFAFSPEIRHGMSGGPIYNANGNICGVNSAGASMYFGEPMSLGSVFYPMLTRPLRFGAKFGPVTINASHTMLDLIAHGTLTTDGSEQHVAFTSNEPGGNIVAHPRSHFDNSGFVHDDFEAFQQGKGASKLNGEFMRIKMSESEPEN
ncbi:hypothetical protein U716_01520 [Rhodobacter capsulatus B6]|nr:hypothetical protein U716_01520 [Rhodobacter capsulatus B6]